jgi:hypothetical protein
VDGDVEKVGLLRVKRPAMVKGQKRVHYYAIVEGQHTRGTLYTLLNNVQREALIPVTTYNRARQGESEQACMSSRNLQALLLLTCALT